MTPGSAKARCPVPSALQLLGALRHAGVRPGAMVSVTSSPDGVTVGGDRATAVLPASAAAHVFVAEP
ncbi:hypothetical protein ACQEV9_44400 [Streptomyces chartreusis]|uniref:hypothetical protein n=1 Tax=Streptomyces chartreusis TaxID=1969 RepID=UPI003D8DD26F